jgi:UDPglucose 6-dehydrogenase
VSGATDKLAYKYPFRFAFNPEFLREKSAVEDMRNTDRVVIGANDEKSSNQLCEIYKPLFPNAKYVLVTRREAEMIKYAANVTLASQVTIANEIFQICKAAGINYEVVKNAILLDKRIGSNISVPGHDGDFGFGGKCFPKDLKALIRLAQEHEYDPYLLQEIWRTNERVRKNKDWLKIRGATSTNNYL